MALDHAETLEGVYEMGRRDGARILLRALVRVYEDELVAYMKRCFFLSDDGGLPEIRARIHQNRYAMNQLELMNAVLDSTAAELERIFGCSHREEEE